MNSNRAMMGVAATRSPRRRPDPPYLRRTRGELPVWDVEGREYLDFAGGIAVLNTGHLHPQIVAAVEDQLKSCRIPASVLAYEPYLALCEKMNQKVPAKKTLLVTTGSEAVENAVKIARAATGRSGAIAFGAYHGRTHVADRQSESLLRRLNAGPCLSPSTRARCTASVMTRRSPASIASSKTMPRRKISPPSLEPR